MRVFRISRPPLSPLAPRPSLLFPFPTLKARRREGRETRVRRFKHAHFRTPPPPRQEASKITDLTWALTGREEGRRGRKKSKDISTGGISIRFKRMVAPWRDFFSLARSGGPESF